MEGGADQFLRVLLVLADLRIFIQDYYTLLLSHITLNRESTNKQDSVY